MVTGSLDPTVLRMKPSKVTFSLVSDLVNMVVTFQIGGQHNPKVFMGRDSFKGDITHVNADINGKMRSSDVHDHTFGGIERTFVDIIILSNCLQIGLRLTASCLNRIK